MSDQSDEIAAAVAALARGELVAFPTETVYGLGADAMNPAAVARVFAAKGRPVDHPLIVHIGGADGIARWASEVPPLARRLAQRFWPGPLTLILPRAAHVPAAVTGGQDSVGLRCPAHPVAQDLLAACARAGIHGLAAPSANRFGRLSPTTAAHVVEELGEAAALVLDGGPCAVGLESTIVDLTGEAPRVLRPGMIDTAALAAAIGGTLEAPAGAVPRVSGSLAQHYAPATRLRLVPAAELASSASALARQGLRCAVLAPAATVAALTPPPAAVAVAAAAPADYARALFASLRALDAASVDVILVETPPRGAAWDAIRDRLQRAAAAGAGAPHRETPDPLPGCAGERGE